MKTGFSKILVGIDGSEESMKAAGCAISIAKLYDADLVVINVLSSDIGYMYSSQDIEIPPLATSEIILLAKEEEKNGLTKLGKKQIKKKFKLKQSLL